MANRKPAKGQVSFLGDFYQIGLKYPPRVSRSPEGLAVVIYRLPPDVSDIDRKMTEAAAHELARETKSILPNWKRRS